VNDIFDPLRPDEDIQMTKAYDLNGNVITETLYANVTSLTRKTFTQYDNLNRPVTVTTNYVNGVFDPLKPDEDLQQLIGYDAAGNVLTMTMYANIASLARTTRTEYDVLNRAVTITTNYVKGFFDPLKPSEDIQTLKGYDANNNVLTTTTYANVPTLARKTVTQYDALNRPVTVTTNYVKGFFDQNKPDEDIHTLFGYDGNGNVLTATQYANVSGLTRLTVTQYDPLNRPLTITTNYVDGNFSEAEPDKDIRQVLAYDANGNVITRTLYADVSGLTRKTFTQFDPLNQPITVTTNYVNGAFDPAEPDEDIQRVNVYDPVGRLITSTQASNITGLARTTFLQYDQLDRTITTTINYVNGVFTTTLPAEDVQKLTAYDAAGNVITTTQYANVTGLTRKTFTQYDLLNRPISATLNYVDGVFTTTRTAEDIRNLTAYDAASNVITTTQYANVTGLTRKTFVQYDLLNQPISVTTNYTGTGVFNAARPDENIQTLTEYDAAGLVLTTTLYANVSSLTRKTFTQYDLLNRPISVTANYVDGNFLGTETDRDIRTLSQYDAAGNVLTTTLYANVTGLTRKTFTQYDLLNRPISATMNYVDGVFVSTQPDQDIVMVNGYNGAGDRVRQVEYRGGPGLTTTAITTTYGFDLLSRQVTSTVPLTGTQVANLKVNYDGLGRAIDQVDALSHTVKTQFDLMDRPVTVTVNYTVVPTAPTTGLQVWYKADVGVTTVGSAVSQWDDQSGNGRHATQGTSGNRPTLTSGALNGKPVVTFDGTNDFLTFTYDPNGLTGMTLVLVSANTTDSTGGSSNAERAPLFWNETAAWGTVYLSPFQSNVKFRFGTGQVNNRPSYTRPASIGTAYSTSIATHDNTTDSLYVNGALVFSEGGKLSSLALLQTTGNLGRGYNNNTYFPGSIAEVLVYNRALSDGERGQVEAYLNDKYFPAVEASTVLTVTKPADTNDGACDGDCSLREAVVAANAASNANTILLPAGAYTITRSGSDDTAVNGDLDITNPVTILGAGANVTTILRGAGVTDRLIHVISTGAATLRGVTLQGGNATSSGGGVRNDGQLTLDQVAVVSNTTGGTGGGVYNSAGVVTLTNSSVLSNTTGASLNSGGGVSVAAGTAHLTNVTISGNVANIDGGGLRVSSGATANLNNVTITNNTADNDNNGGDGGGLRNSGALNFQNTTIAGNTDVSGNNEDCFGAITSQGYNHVQVTTGCTIAGDTAGNQTGASANLAALANNGGPTLTHLPNGGSPLIDRANPAAPGSGGTACVFTDQRGYFRPADGNGDGLPRCDIGSVEAGASTTPLAQTIVITYTYDPLYRLTRAGYTDGRVFTYTYDAVGNRLSQLALSATTVYTYDDANRLIKVGAVNYTWDNNGNLLNDGAFTYTHDVANRLVTLKQGTAITTTFGYNGLGHRLRQVTNVVTITYSLDLASGLTQVLADGTNTYLYGNGRIAQQNAALTDYFLPDALGSVRQMATITGTVTLAKGYQPFGSVLTSSGGGASNYGFTGEWTDASGLQHLRARYYAPWQGRFLSADPWAGDPNRPMSYNKWLYAYANPILITDPTGLTPSCAGIPDCGVDGWNPPPKPAPKPPYKPPPPPVMAQPSPAPGYQDPAAGDVGLPVGPPQSAPPSGSPVPTLPAPVVNPATNPVGSAITQHCGATNLENCGGLDTWVTSTNPGVVSTGNSNSSNQMCPVTLPLGFQIWVPCVLQANQTPNGENPPPNYDQEQYCRAARYHYDGLIIRQFSAIAAINSLLDAMLQALDEDEYRRYLGEYFAKLLELANLEKEALREYEHARDMGCDVGDWPTPWAPDSAAPPPPPPPPPPSIRWKWIPVPKPETEPTV